MLEQTDWSVGSPSPTYLSHWPMASFFLLQCDLHAYLVYCLVWELYLVPTVLIAASVCTCTWLAACLSLITICFFLLCSGVHHKRKPGSVHVAVGQCNAESVVSSYRHVLQNNEQHLFSEHVVLVGTNSISFTGRLAKPEGYGGWGDLRDHELCSSYTNASHFVLRSN